MAEAQDFAAVAGVLDTYFEGLYQADNQKLATVFHPDARYVNKVAGDYMNYSPTEYFDIVDGRVAPAKRAELRADRVISIEFGWATYGLRQCSLADAIA